MATGLERRVMTAVAVRHELEALRGNWLWFVLAGVALVILGTVALGSLVAASLAVTLVLGSLILLAGGVEVVGSFWCRRWSGFFLSLLSGVLAIVVGFLFLTAPVNALLALTMLAAAFLLVGGAFKIVAALTYRLAGWGWTLASGVLDVVLGFLIWEGWPATALWVLGMFLGISLIFRGFNWIALGIAFKALPKPDDYRPAGEQRPATA